jgi:hypothetical protein
MSLIIVHLIYSHCRQRILLMIDQGLIPTIDDNEFGNLIENRDKNQK